MSNISLRDPQSYPQSNSESSPTDFNDDSYSEIPFLSPLHQYACDDSSQYVWVWGTMPSSMSALSQPIPLLNGMTLPGISEVKLSQKYINSTGVNDSMCERVYKDAVKFGLCLLCGSCDNSCSCKWQGCSRCNPNKSPFIHTQTLITCTDGSDVADNSSDISTTGDIWEKHNLEKHTSSPNSSYTRSARCQSDSALHPQSRLLRSGSETTSAAIQEEEEKSVQEKGVSITNRADSDVPVDVCGSGSAAMSQSSQGLTQGSVSQRNLVDDMDRLCMCRKMVISPLTGKPMIVESHTHVKVSLPASSSLPTSVSLVHLQPVMADVFQGGAVRTVVAGASHAMLITRRGDAYVWGKGVAVKGDYEVTTEALTGNTDGIDGGNATSTAANAANAGDSVGVNPSFSRYNWGVAISNNDINSTTVDISSSALRRQRVDGDVIEDIVSSFPYSSSAVTNISLPNAPVKSSVFGLFTSLLNSNNSLITATATKTNQFAINNKGELLQWELSRDISLTERSVYLSHSLSQTNAMKPKKRSKGLPNLNLNNGGDESDGDDVSVEDEGGVLYSPFDEHTHNNTHTHHTEIRSSDLGSGGGNGVNVSMASEHDCVRTTSFEYSDTNTHSNTHTNSPLHGPLHSDVTIDGSSLPYLYPRTPSVAHPLLRASLGGMPSVLQANTLGCISDITQDVFNVPAFVSEKNLVLNDGVEGKVAQCTVIPLNPDMPALPHKVSSLNNEQVLTVSANFGFTACVTASGRVLTWGRSSHGRLGYGEVNHNDLVPMPRYVSSIIEHNVIDVACGWSHMLFTNNIGQVYSLGCGLSNKLGTGTLFDTSIPTLLLPNHTSPIVHIACGYRHSVAVDASGAVFAWGGNDFGQLGVGDRRNRLQPTLVRFNHATSVTQTGSSSAEANQSKALLPASPMPVQSQSASAATRPATRTATNDEMSIGESAHIIKICCGPFHTMAICSSGCLYVWGQNSHQQLGVAVKNEAINTVISDVDNLSDITHEFITSPIVVSALVGYDVLSVDTNGKYSICVTNTNVSVDNYHYNSSNTSTFPSSPSSPSFSKQNQPQKQQQQPSKLPSSSSFSISVSAPSSASASMLTPSRGSVIRTTATPVPRSSVIVPSLITDSSLSDTSNRSRRSSVANSSPVANTTLIRTMSNPSQSIHGKANIDDGIIPSSLVQQQMSMISQEQGEVVLPPPVSVVYHQSHPLHSVYQVNYTSHNNENTTSMYSDVISALVDPNDPEPLPELMTWHHKLSGFDMNGYINADNPQTYTETSYDKVTSSSDLASILDDSQVNLHVDEDSDDDDIPAIVNPLLTGANVSSHQTSFLQPRPFLSTPVTPSNHKTPLLSPPRGSVTSVTPRGSLNMGSKAPSVRTSRSHSSVVTPSSVSALSLKSPHGRGSVYGDGSVGLFPPQTPDTHITLSQGVHGLFSPTMQQPRASITGRGDNGVNGVGVSNEAMDIAGLGLLHSSLLPYLTQSQSNTNRTCAPLSLMMDVLKPNTNGSNYDSLSDSAGLGGMGSADLQQLAQTYQAKLHKDARDKLHSQQEQLKQQRNAEKDQRKQLKIEQERDRVMLNLEKEWKSKVLDKLTISDAVDLYDNEDNELINNSEVKLNAQKLTLQNGIPSKLRRTIWPLAIGNKCEVSQDYFLSLRAKSITCRRHYQQYKQFENTKTPFVVDENILSPYMIKCFSDIDVDLVRTFPNLAFYQNGSQLKNNMRNVLDAFCFYNTTLGYVQGLSYLVGKLLLYLDEFPAFLCICNMLDTHYFTSVFHMDYDSLEARYQLFEWIFKETIPDLYAHFKSIDVFMHGKTLYFLDWVMTLFSKRLELDLTSRIWDLYFLHGESIVYLTCVALLSCLKDDMIDQPFEKVHKVLTRMTRNINEADLVKAIRSIRWRQRYQRALDNILATKL